MSENVSVWDNERLWDSVWQSEIIRQNFDNMTQGEALVKQNELHRNLLNFFLGKVLNKWEKVGIHYMSEQNSARGAMTF